MEEAEKEGALVKEKNEKLKKILLFIVGLQVLALGATMFFLFSRGSGSSGGGEGSSSSTLLPLWIAIFIPIIVSQNKKKTGKEMQKRMYMLIGLAILVLLGIVLVFLKASS